MSASVLLCGREVDAGRLSVPKRGHVLSTVTEVYSGPIREAVALLSEAFSGILLPARKSYAESPTRLLELGVKRSNAEMAARHICAQWAVVVALGFLGPRGDLADALRWFDEQNPLLSALHSVKLETVEAALARLRSVAMSSALADLLPYILDPHGPGSRLSVMRDPSTKGARANRRAQGVFYTPADVAEHMADTVLRDTDLSMDRLRVLDPACGTGVFLRAVLRFMIAHDAHPIKVAEACLFGIDIDPWALDATAYVLVHDALASARGLSKQPSSVWGQIRNHLVMGDALSIDPPKTIDRPMLFSFSRPSRRFTIPELFPDIGAAPNVIIGNPPYARIDPSTDVAELSDVFATLPKTGIAPDMYPLFLEQMIRLAPINVSGAFVLPLSIAFSAGQQFQAARRLMDQTPGTWRFSFFDREPHALFGEDVKTRNAIVSWRRTAGDHAFACLTGPLLKWRSQDRARMFQNIRYTEISGPIATGIPKLCSRTQAEALERLNATGNNLASLVNSFHSTTLERTFSADERSVFVGGTGYNFLNVFLRPPAHLLDKSGLISANTVHELSCSTIEEAFASFALLSSGVAFWLWHTVGDGFHVSRGFLQGIPLGLNLFNKAFLPRLASAGRRLWSELQTRPVTSMNRGRASVSFPASRLRQQQRAIDLMILQASGLPSLFLEELESFIDCVVFAIPQCETDAKASEEVTEAK